MPPTQQSSARRQGYSAKRKERYSLYEIALPVLTGTPSRLSEAMISAGYNNARTASTIRSWEGMTSSSRRSL